MNTQINIPKSQILFQNTNTLMEKLNTFKNKEHELVEKIVKAGLEHLQLQTKDDLSLSKENIEKFEVLQKQENYVHILKKVLGIELEMYALLLIREKECLPQQFKEPISQKHANDYKNLAHQISISQKIIFNQNNKLLEKISFINQKMQQFQSNSVTSFQQKKKINLNEMIDNINFGYGLKEIEKTIFEKSIEYYKIHSNEKIGQKPKETNNTSTTKNYEQVFLYLKSLNNTICLQQELYSILLHKDQELLTTHSEKKFETSIPSNPVDLLEHFEKGNDQEKKFKSLLQEVAVLKILIQSEFKLINDELWRISKTY